MSVLHGEEEVGVGEEANCLFQLETLPPWKLEAGPATYQNRETDRQTSKSKMLC